MTDEPTDEIRPALSAKGWAGMLAGTGRDSSTDIAIGCVWAELSNDERDVTGDVEVMEQEFGERRPMLVLDWNYASDRIAVSDRHALAALALYQQPFGFTQEDVAFLREIESSNALAWTAQARSLASRIAALLPPAP